MKYRIIIETVGSSEYQTAYSKKIEFFKLKTKKQFPYNAKEEHERTKNKQPKRRKGGGIKREARSQGEREEKMWKKRF